MSGAGKFSCELEMGREEGWEGVPSLWEEGTNKERRDGVAQTGGEIRATIELETGKTL